MVLDGWIFEAVSKGRLEEVSQWLSHGGDVNMRRLDGGSLMHEAAALSVGDPKPMIDLLVKHGGSLVLGTDGGKTPLHLAAINNRVDSAAALIRHCADMNIKDLSHGNTPLFVAVRYGNTEMVEFLLKHGADPMVRNSDGARAVDFAKAIGRSDLVDLLGGEDNSRTTSKTNHRNKTSRDR
jgi:ankyrin repeat protein